eukprot:jgi/Tetstr1/441222/TSEL_029478.t1
MGATLDVGEWVSKKGRRPRAPHVTQPRQMACWTKSSVLEGNQLRYGDTSGLLRFKMPKLPADLNGGFPEAFIEKRADEHSPVEQVAGALRTAAVPWSEADVVTFRNNLNKISLTPLKPGDGWIVHGCQGRGGGPLFLDINPRTQPAGEAYPNERLFSYYGYKFEQLCTEGEAAYSTGAPPTVDSTSEFAAVMRIRLGAHRIMMGAEMDCCWEGMEGEAEGAAYVELKTFKTPRHRGQWNTLARLKYPTWWVQSWLAGVSRIGMGERDERGQLVDVQVVSTRQLPKMSAGAGHPWDPWEYVSFADDVLSWMRSQAAASEGQHLTFEYHPDQKRITATVDPDGTLDVLCSFSNGMADESAPPGEAASALSSGQQAQDPEEISCTASW